MCSLGNNETDIHNMIGIFILENLGQGLQKTLHRKLQTLTTIKLALQDLMATRSTLIACQLCDCGNSSCLQGLLNESHHRDVTLKGVLAKNSDSNESLLAVLMQNYKRSETLQTSAKLNSSMNLDKSDVGSVDIDLPTAVRQSYTSGESLKMGLEKNCETSRCLNASLNFNISTSRTLQEELSQSRAADGDLGEALEDEALHERSQTAYSQTLQRALEQNSATIEKLQYALQQNSQTIELLQETFEKNLETRKVLMMMG